MGEGSTPGLPGFDRRFFESEQRFTCIGRGALGGKASSLATVHQRILPCLDLGEFPLMEVTVPTLTVLTTEVFERFMDLNDLWPTALSDLPDDRMAHAFQRAELPPQWVGDLAALISRVHTPLAVRSSSLLEDALEHPFAGVYSTKMIPNNEIEADARFRRLVEAIRLVYASTFFRAAKSYARSVGKSVDSERMAVVIQEVIGERVGDRFYPVISGVARSYNFYPTGHGGPEDGVSSLALGLGKTIVDGGLSWTYCPAFPKAPQPFNSVADLLKNTQTSFWAVNMGPPPMPDPIRETECLVEGDLAQAEEDGALKFTVSTYDAGSDRLNAGLATRGPRALTFAPLLGSRFIRMNDLIRRLLEISRQVVGTHVEIEFAVTLDRAEGLPARLGYLQVRPMRVEGAEIQLSAQDLESDRVLVPSEIVLGNGRRTGIEDVVFLKPETFDAAKTPLMALELDAVNRRLCSEGRTYALIGFGRWGSSDPWLGVPVAWGQISGARVIVEATMERMKPDLSQGSHFFHNLLSFQILYLSVEHDGPHRIDWEWLQAQPVVSDGPFVRHVRCSVPLTAVVDGRARRGVVTRDQ